MHVHGRPTVLIHHAAVRQQIEDLEGKVKILKEQLKKKEENETKYQGKGTGMPPGIIAMTLCQT